MDIRQMKKVLVPVDFSDQADEALRTAIGVARAFGGEVELLHVTAPVMVLPPPIDIISFPTLFPDLTRRVEESLASRRAWIAEAGLSSTTTVLQGNPHVEIVRRAKESGAELIVMGTHGRSGFGHAVLGSVAERVVHRSPCPVLVVPVRAE